MNTKSKILELFNYSTKNSRVDWKEILKSQHCGYLNKKCIKVRKSAPSISIGSCTVIYGKDEKEIIICPHRFLENKKIFLDAIHLLTLHEPGNELHIVPEISIPGGSVDYFLASVKNGKIKDFVGVELQTLDTTGTVWPERQKFIHSLGMKVKISDLSSDKPYGMNWKMTAKTILVQLHHKIETFEHLNKHLVLVLQNHLLEYMRNEFSFSHISSNPRIGDAMHFHAYTMTLTNEKRFHIALSQRLSTDSNGIAVCMGLQAEAKVKLELIIKDIESRISNKTLFTI